MKILFLVPYPEEGASNRIRVMQFVPYLKSKGIFCRIRPFVNGRFYRILYLPYRYAEKAVWFLTCTINRIFDIARSLRYDIIFIHREAYPFGGPIIESILYRMGKPIIYDFDDAIFLSNTSEHNIYIEKFKKPGKVSAIIKMSRLVIAGNEYLKNYASGFNKNVIIIPSSIDTDRYCRATSENNKKDVVIGWIGSNTTKSFLKDIEDVFAELSDRYRNVVFKIIGAEFYSRKVNNVINKRWVLNEEMEDLNDFDIGIMPMPDNEWTRGKCGFKIILYMACGIPAVCSPVGVNSAIIEDNVSGFLAKDNREWVDKLSRLIEDKKLRDRLGAAGRKRVENNYSVKVNASKLVDAIRRTGRE